ncbi:MAG: PepSY domain-containing protein [Cellulosilyticaceae bacterium]
MKLKKLAWTMIAFTIATTSLYAAPAGNHTKPAKPPVTAPGVTPGFKPVTPGTGAVTSDQATALVHQMMPKGAEHVETKKSVMDDETYYEVFFTYKTMRIAALVEADCGEIEKIVAEDTAFVGLKVKNLFSKNPNYKAKIKVKDAEAKAMGLLKESKVTEKTQLGEHKGLWAYSVVVANDGMKLQVILDTETNAVKAVYAYPQTDDVTTEKPDPEKPVKPGVDGLLTKDQVISIIQKKFKKVTVIKIELDKEDGKYVYEVEGTDGKFEYEFEIDAKTGKILDMDKDKMDDDHDDEEWDD